MTLLYILLVLLSIIIVLLTAQLVWAWQRIFELFADKEFIYERIKYLDSQYTNLEIRKADKEI